MNVASQLVKNNVAVLLIHAELYNITQKILMLMNGMFIFLSLLQ